MKFRLSAFLVFFPLLMSQAMSSMAGSDDLFLAARDAARAGDRNKLERLAPDLQGYELEVLRRLLAPPARPLGHLIRRRSVPFSHATIKATLPKSCVATG